MFRQDRFKYGAVSPMDFTNQFPEGWESAPPAPQTASFSPWLLLLAVGVIGYAWARS